MFEDDEETDRLAEVYDTEFSYWVRDYGDRVADSMARKAVWEARRNA